MKTKAFNTLAGFVVVVALLVALPALASKAPQIEAMKKNLRAVSVLEMPAKAAQLVSMAKADEREAVALTVVSAAAQLKPAAIVPVVGAVVRVVPEAAPLIAVTAVMQQPKQAGAITKAAVAAAPDQAGKIVAAVSKQAPKQSDEVVMAAVQAAPNASKQIAEAASPKGAQGSEVPLAGPPVVGPPFTLTPPPPLELGRGNTVVVPPGGSRDYASP